MPDKDSTKGKLVETETNEKKDENRSKSANQISERKMPDKTTIYEKLVEAFYINNQDRKYVTLLV